MVPPQRGTGSSVHSFVKVCLATVVLVSACARPDAAPSEAPAPDPIVARAVETSLPAGLYFRNGYVYCPDCAEPRWAVVAGVFDDPDAARRAMLDVHARAPARLGFPFAVHTDELALVDRERVGIAVVVAWFEHEAEAREHADAQLEAVELLDSEAAWEIEAASDRLRRRFVVQLDADGPVAAFDAKTIVAAEEALSSQTWDSYAEYLERRDVVMDELAARCRLAPDRLFVSDDARFEREDMLGYPYQWQPVTCDDGTPVWVRQADTRRQTIVLPTDDGPVLEQVILVECDVARRGRWLWAGHHRRRDEDIAQPASGHC